MDKKQKRHLLNLRIIYMDLKTPEGDRMAAAITKELLEDEADRKPRKKHKPVKSASFKIEITDNHGNVMEYESARDANYATNIPIASIYKYAKRDEVVSRGRYEGYRFRKKQPEPEHYAVYQGEEILATGTVEECAKTLDVKPETIRWMAQPVAKRRLGERKRSKPRYAIRVED